MFWGLTYNEWLLVTLLVAESLLGLVGMGAAYRNGCCDGYLFARDKHAPGARVAWKVLWECEAHRWPTGDIPEPPK